MASVVKVKDISVALCTYNGEKHLREQLQSIANQTVLPSEVVLCDDRSTDSSVEIAKEFARSVPFDVKVIENEKNIGSTKRGITGNFEKTIGLCRGELIVLSDQDDVWFPDKLARQSEVLEGNSQLGGVFSDARLIDQDSNPTGVQLCETTGFNSREQRWLREGRSLRVLLGMNKVYGCTLMFRASLLDQVLPIPMSWTHDNWIACMTATHAQLAFISDPLISYRVHPRQFYGAAAPSLSERMKFFKRSAREYWDEARPQLIDLRERLQLQNDPRLQPHIEYLSGRLALLERRASLPSNRFMRINRILVETANYHKYFNGWRSIIKDIAA